MNLTDEPTDLQAVAQARTATPPPGGPKRLTLILGGGLMLAVIAIIAMATALLGNDSEAAATVVTDDSEATVVTDESSAGDHDASTGNASVDEQIVDSIWEGSSGRSALCPAFDDVKRAMPSLSDEEIWEMGVSLAGGMDEMTPAQLERMRELVLTEC